MFDKIAQNIQTEDLSILFRKSLQDKKFKYDFETYSSSVGIKIEINSNETGKQIRYTTNQIDFGKIPGSPIAYWVSERVKEIFEKSKKLRDLGYPKQGLATGDNNKFLRTWREVSINKVGLGCKNSQEAIESKTKWFPCNKGGNFRRWYGNNEIIINWENNGYEIKTFFDDKGKLRSRPQNIDFYFREGFTWSTISSSKCSFRYSPLGYIFETKGSTYFPKNQQDSNYIFGFLNTKIVNELLLILSPTLDYHEGPMGKLPVEIDNKIREKVENIVKYNINISKQEWDSRETSWDFEKSPLLMEASVTETYKSYCDFWTKEFFQMHSNEEELNRLFIEIYGLQDEIDEKVQLKDITLLKNEIMRVKSKGKKKKSEDDEEEDSSIVMEDGKPVFNRNEIAKQLLSYISRLCIRKILY